MSDFILLIVSFGSLIIAVTAFGFAAYHHVKLDSHWPAEQHDAEVE